MLPLDELEDYPLAKAYGWKAPKRDTGGMLYIYPPIKKFKDKKCGGKHVLERERLESLNPYDLSPHALDEALGKMN